MTSRRVTTAAFVAYAASFGMLVAAAVLMLYGLLGASRGMVWTAVALSGGAVVGTAASLVMGRR